jgi:hypothetical protein
MLEVVVVVLGPLQHHQFQFQEALEVLEEEVMEVRVQSAKALLAPLVLMEALILEVVVVEMVRLVLMVDSEVQVVPASSSSNTIKHLLQIKFSHLMQLLSLSYQLV